MPLERRLIRLCEIDPLSRPKNDALASIDIGRHSPQSKSDIERVDPKRGPEGNLPDPMLFRMASGAQRNGVAIARFHPDTAIGSGPHMRGL